MLCEVVALVKSPATRIPFYVVKGGETMDELLPVAKEICKGIDWDARESRAMSEADQQKALAASVAIKGVFKDLPPEVQKAVSDLLAIAVSTTKTVKSAAQLEAEKKAEEDAKKALEEKEKSEKSVLDLLSSVKQSVEDSEKKASACIEELKKTVLDLGERIVVVEKSAGAGHSKAPEDGSGTPPPAKGASIWRGAVPDSVLIQGPRGGE